MRLIIRRDHLFSLEVVAFIFTVIVGSALHFTYELSGKSNIVALFSAVNESTWEHLKIAFFPILIFALIEHYYLNKSVQNLFFGKLTAYLTMAILIIVAFYSYTYFTRDSILIADIIVFILSALIGHLLSYRIIRSTREYKLLNLISAFLFVIIAILFMYFTFIPLDNLLFVPPPEH